MRKTTCLLEEKIVPLFYEHDLHDAPQGWIEVMREPIKSVAPVFCADRMVKDYTTQMYRPPAPAEVAAPAGSASTALAIRSQAGTDPSDIRSQKRSCMASTAALRPKR